VVYTPTGESVVAKAKTKKRRTNKAETPEAYAKRLAWQSEANRKATVSLRDFGRFPAVKNPGRKRRAATSLKRFCESYLKATFDLEWSPDHLLVMKKMEIAVRKGGLFALAMPRGSGKTSLTEAAALWAIVFGYRRYVFLIGATEAHAVELLQSIRIDIESNDKLLEDFPSICIPFRKLEGVATRKLYSGGKRVDLKLSEKELRFPWIIGGKNGKGAGAIIGVRGITGAIRGAKSKLRDGRTVRPDFVIPDDPQTDESAGAPAQTAKREKTIAGAVLGLAGPGKKIAAVLPVTVIEEGDLADRMLDHKLHPEWQGLRIPFVKSFPTAVNLWEQYRETRAESFRRWGDNRDGNKFYRSHRKELDDGAEVSWEARFEEDELSAIQHAMNKRFSDEVAFWSEYQNDPRESSDEETKLQTVTEIASRVNGIDRLDVISSAQYLTGFVDVQQRVLYYALIAWRSDFTGALVDYGTFPDQGRRYYALSDLTRTLQRAYPKAGVDGAITAGLSGTMDHIFGREYVREDDGALLIPNLVLTDANWKTSVVRDFCRRRRSPAIVPAHGRFAGASSRPIAEYKKSKGERSGLHWKSSVIERLTHILFDTNFWKSFAHERLAIPFGDSGNLSLFGSDPTAHRMIAEHLLAEYRVRVTNNATGRTVDEWKLKASRPDNHILDCIVGACVAGSIMGASLPGLDVKKPTNSKRRRRRRSRIGYM
jgi:hypothetical protein